MQVVKHLKNTEHCCDLLESFDKIPKKDKGDIKELTELISPLSKKFQEQVLQGINNSLVLK